MKLIAIAAAVLVTALAASPAFAGEGRRARRLERVFARVDADGDGRISRAEAEATRPRLARHFDRVDENRDGFVTREELVAAWKRRHAKP